MLEQITVPIWSKKFKVRPRSLKNKINDNHWYYNFNVTPSSHTYIQNIRSYTTFLGFSTFKSEWEQMRLFESFTFVLFLWIFPRWKILLYLYVPISKRNMYLFELFVISRLIKLVQPIIHAHCIYVRCKVFIKASHLV